MQKWVFFLACSLSLSLFLSDKSSMHSVINISCLHQRSVHRKKNKPRHSIKPGASIGNIGNGLKRSNLSEKSITNRIHFAAGCYIVDARAYWIHWVSRSPCTNSTLNILRYYRVFEINIRFQKIRKNTYFLLIMEMSETWMHRAKPVF